MSETDPWRAVPVADRIQLERIHSVLDLSSRSFWFDVERGSWALRGYAGNQISVWGDGESFRLFVTRWSPRAWSAVRKRLAFCESVWDATHEGVFRLRLPLSEEQAAAIREIGGFRKRPDFTEEFVSESIGRLHRAQQRAKIRPGPITD